ncbi:MAG: glycine cleavage system aminomethyltransferase GcvT [Acidobacteria bacterium]|nr:glycine cleavage system aminomethyltransferase GcvT [Acidobacteriota bacterium]
MLKRTPLYESHVSLGARMVDFAGWNMPVQYSGPIPEHLAVRNAAGLFDVSHMGEIELHGDNALALVQSLTSNDVAKLEDNQVQYSCLTNERGGIIDDLLVYRISAEYFLLVVNASNIAKDFAWIKQHADAMGNVNAYDVSLGYSLLALQGPKAEDILQDITDHMLDRIPYYWSQKVAVDGIECRVSRTGYTGEDGFEIFCDPKDALHLWNRLLTTGQSDGLLPCGLAARNTTRLEASFRLWGNDMDDTTTPLEAGLGWITKLNKGEFIGRDAIRQQKAQGLQRQLAGFVVEDRAAARDGYAILIDGQEVSKVASGSPAPYLQKNIGMAYLPIAHSAVGTALAINIRGREVPAHVVEMPFYKRQRQFD